MTKIRLGRAIYQTVSPEDIMPVLHDMETARSTVRRLVGSDVARLREFLDRANRLGLRPERADPIEIAARLLLDRTYSLVRIANHLRPVDSPKIRDLTDLVRPGPHEDLTPRLSVDSRAPERTEAEGLSGGEPTTNEPYGDEAGPEVRTTAPTQVGVSTTPDVDALVPLLQAEDIHFGNERVVFLPEPPRGADVASSDRVTGLSVARAVLEYAYLNPTKHLVFVGHADALGSTGVNLRVSRDRAENTMLLISGQRAEWASHCFGHFATDDVQQLLAWTATTWGWDTDAGAIDNVAGSRTQGALDRFRVEYNKEFSTATPSVGPTDVADFLAFFDVMHAALADMITPGMPALPELHNSLTLLDDGVIACGEGWVHEPILMVDYPESSFRRIDVLFLDAHEVSLARIESTPPLRELYGNVQSTARPFGVWYVDDGTIDAFTYRREGDFIHLEFSTRPEVRKPLRVRLYEYTSAVSSDERRSAIQRDALTLGDEPGLRKSGVLHNISEGESIAAIAAKYGSTREAIVAHPRNAAAADASAALFVPQVDASEPLALGPLLNADPIADEDGRPRFAAKWPISESGYDVLYPQRWLPETDLSDSQGLFAEAKAEIGDPAPVLPHFVVFDASNRVLGVAPSPAEIARSITYSGSGGRSKGAVLVKLDGTIGTLDTDSGTQELKAEEAVLMLLTAGDSP